MTSGEEMPREVANLLAAADRREDVTIDDVANVALRVIIYRKFGVIEPAADSLIAVKECVDETNNETIISDSVADAICRDEELVGYLVELDGAVAREEVGL